MSVFGRHFGVSVLTLLPDVQGMSRDGRSYQKWELLAFVIREIRYV